MSVMRQFISDHVMLIRIDRELVVASDSTCLNVLLDYCDISGHKVLLYLYIQCYIDNTTNYTISQCAYLKPSLMHAFRYDACCIISFVTGAFLSGAILAISLWSLSCLSGFFARQ